MDKVPVEVRTHEIGRQIFAAAAREQPRAGSAPWWDERMMSLTMRDEAVKVQLFRFIDALPALRSPRQITSHLREYFGEIRDHLPGLMRAAVDLIPHDGWGGSAIAAAARFNANRLAHRFIAGTDLQQTLKSIVELRKQGLAFTIDLLGEAVVSEAEAEQYQRQYLQFITGLSADASSWPTVDLIDRDASGALPRVNISVKLSSLYSQFDPVDPEGTTRIVRERLRPILREARRVGAFVNIDMEQYAFKDLTIQIFQEVLDEQEFRDWGDVGIAIQAYLKDCGQDLKRLADWAKRRGRGVWVRLVKGAYWDYELIVAGQQGWMEPVFRQKAETDANYEEQTRFLLDHHEVLRPAFATHNVRSIAHALALVEQRGLAPRRIEFQMLYGMADPIKKALVRMRQRVRVYTPFGQLLPGMAYLVRRLLENTSNQSFLRAGFLEHAPIEKLMVNPLELLRQRRVIPAKPSPNEPTRFVNEPLADFAIEANRRAMADALKSVRCEFGGTFPAIIGHESTRPEAFLEAVNPSHTDQVIGRTARSTVDDAQRAVAAALRAFPAWRDTPVEDRAQLLRRAAEILRKRRFELAAWEGYECGKPWREADSDVAEAIDYCEYYANEMLRLSARQHRPVPGEENDYFYEGRGVAVTIAPWNFPLAILCGMTTAALVAGNTAIMKPAEQSSIVGAKLMEVFVQAGFPAGVVNYLPGVGEELGPALVNQPDVSILAFTGSRSVGLWINREGAVVREGQIQIKRIIAELGGKNAIIIDEDADLDEAVRGVAASAFGYAGQKCSACSRVIVLESVCEAFLPRLVEATASLRVGPAEDPGTFVGPVIDAEAHRRIHDYIQTGKKEGELAYPADSNGDEGSGSYCIRPHIFTNVAPTADIAQEEIFGPVLAVLRAGDLTEALRIANGTKYALTGGLYSRSPASIARVRRDFHVGNLYINRKITGALVDRQPFGGFRLSGMGFKAGGPDYLLQFVQARTITENTLRRGFAPTTSGEGTSPAAAGE